MDIVGTELNTDDRYGFAYDIDQWYEKCKEFTFETHFLDISAEEASVMCKHYEINELKHEIKLTDSEIEVFKKLEAKIDNVLMTYFYNEEEDSVAAFVRMSSRSPKDAALSSHEMKEIITRKLYERKATFKRQNKNVLDKIDEQNIEFISFFEAQKEAMKFDSAERVLSLHCSSTRVYDDLRIALQYKYQNEDRDWNIKMVFRKWQNDHDIAMEFRGFVYNRKLTALSQYFDPLYFEKLVIHKSEYLNAITQFFESVKSQIPFDNCIMDFLITELNNDDDDGGDDEEEEEEEEDRTDDRGNSNDDNGPKNFNIKYNVKEVNENDLKVQVIEFNPFNRFTGASLFSWTKDLDRLTGKIDDEIEFRVLEKPISILPNNIMNEASNSNERKNMIQFNLMDVDPSIMEDFSDVLQEVEEFMNDDVARINGNLKYVLGIVSKESFLNYFAARETE